MRLVWVEGVNQRDAARDRDVAAIAGVQPRHLSVTSPRRIVVLSQGGPGASRHDVLVDTAQVLGDAGRVVSLEWPVGPEVLEGGAVTVELEVGGARRAVRRLLPGAALRPVSSRRTRRGLRSRWARTSCRVPPVETHRREHPVPSRPDARGDRPRRPGVSTRTGRARADAADWRRWVPIRIQMPSAPPRRRARRALVMAAIGTATSPGSRPGRGWSWRPTSCGGPPRRPRSPRR